MRNGMSPVNRPSWFPWKESLNPGSFPAEHQQVKGEAMTNGPGKLKGQKVDSPLAAASAGSRKRSGSFLRRLRPDGQAPGHLRWWKAAASVWVGLGLHGF